MFPLTVNSNKYFCIVLMFTTFVRRDKINTTNIGRMIMVDTAVESEWTKMEEKLRMKAYHSLVYLHLLCYSSSTEVDTVILG